MNKIVVTLLSAILMITPFVMDRNFFVTNARRGIDLQNLGTISEVTTNITTNGTVTTGGGSAETLMPAFIQVNGQIYILKQITQSLYQNFNK